MTEEQINELAKTIYEQNVERGWWDDPDRCVYRTLQLVNTEIAEATEGDRKDLMDDHLPHRKMVEVELADTLIRLLDLAGRYKWVYTKCDPFLPLKGYTSLGQAHFWLTADVCSIGKALHGITLWLVGEAYSRAVQNILYVAEREGYDLMGATEEKLEYNRVRADHNRNNRAKDHGKKY